jgi:glycosyltransferase involved in cell wall biosynthesis
MDGRPILHVITRLEAGGAPRSLLLLLEGLRAAGIEVELATGRTSPPTLDMLPEAERLGIPVHVVRHLRRDPHPWHDTAALVELIRLIRRRRPVLVHAHTSKAGFLGRLAARLTGVPSVYSPRGTILEGYFTGLRRGFFLRLDRLAARWSSFIVGLTPEESASYLAAGIGRPGQHVHIPIGVDCTLFAPPEPAERTRRRRELGLVEGELLLLSVGRLVPVKDQATLVRGLALLPADLPPWRCWIVGAGPEQEGLSRLITESGLAGRVRLTGHTDEVPRLLGLGDLFLLTSVNEGFGRVLLEAMAAGLPVVATSVGGIPSVLDDGKVGRLVPPRNPDALAGVLAPLLLDSGERARLARLGRERVRTAYSLEAGVQQHRELYRRVLGDGSANGLV